MAENVREKLLNEFAPNSTQEWKDKVVADLKGADFDKKLVWRTNEGFNVQPMYRLEDMESLKNLECFPGEFPYVRGNKKDNNKSGVTIIIPGSEAITPNPFVTIVVAVATSQPVSVAKLTINNAIINTRFFIFFPLIRP